MGLAITVKYCCWKNPQSAIDNKFHKATNISRIPLIIVFSIRRLARWPAKVTGYFRYAGAMIYFERWVNLVGCGSERVNDVVDQLEYEAYQLQQHADVKHCITWK